MARSVSAAVEPEGMNLSQANGRAAGQSIYHYHTHNFQRPELWRHNEQGAHAWRHGAHRRGLQQYSGGYALDDPEFP